MARKGYRDPWGKKSKAGMKIFNKGMKTAFTVGSAVVNETSKKGRNQIKSNSQNNSQPSLKGCFPAIIVFGVGLLLTIIIKQGISFSDVILSFIIWGAIAFIISIIITVTSNTKKDIKEKEEILSETDLLTINKITEIISSQEDYSKVNSLIETFDKNKRKKILVKSFEKTIDKFLNDGILSLEEENRISDFKNYFEVNQEELNINGYYEKTVQASILRSILQGVIPESKFKISEGNSPFLLEKNEEIIWIFQDVSYFEDQINKQFLGNSNGISLKIANGLYYKTGTFRGQQIVTRELKFIDYGIIGFTNKNIYFYSSQKSIKIPYNKIITLQPYEDGIGIHKDGASAKPQIFKNLSGWFAYNLISNITRI